MGQMVYFYSRYNTHVMSLQAQKIFYVLYIFRVTEALCRYKDPTLTQKDIITILSGNLTKKLNVCTVYIHT